eukprot:363336-Chlamydomonas_euryale.AAC.8
MYAMRSPPCAFRHTPCAMQCTPCVRRHAPNAMFRAPYAIRCAVKHSAWQRCFLLRVDASFVNVGREGLCTASPPTLRATTSHAARLAWHPIQLPTTASAAVEEEKQALMCQLFISRPTFQTCSPPWPLRSPAPPHRARCRRKSAS